jgi:uncharacterized protein YPO0396
MTPTHEQELAVQLAQSLVRIDALKFELARAREQIAELKDAARQITPIAPESLIEQSKLIAALEAALEKFCPLHKLLGNDHLPKP